MNWAHWVVAALACLGIALTLYSAIESGRVLAGTYVFDRTKSPASYWFFVILRGISFVGIGVYFVSSRN